MGHVFDGTRRWLEPPSLRRWTDVVQIHLLTPNLPEPRTSEEHVLSLCNVRVAQYDVTENPNLATCSKCLEAHQEAI